ncbi:MAG: hypothetical protein ABSF23_15025 [Terracidiphilus sp.]|jgi:hypothetical protein
MTGTAELATDESECEIPDRLTENDAVARCVRAWRLTMKKEREELDEGDSEYEAEKASNNAYLGAMPPLSGYQNICDFIACVTNGSMVGVIPQRDAEHFLAAAKIALGALRLEPKPAASAQRRPGRPRKTAAKEENK